MRTRVIPAQITTVEDRIAGNLNFTQVTLLVIPVFWTLLVYIAFLPIMRFAWYKLPVIGIVTLLCLILSIRIKGKVLLNWLVILLRFNTRPTYYLFNKNDTTERIIDLPVFEKRQRKAAKKSPIKEENEAQAPTVSIGGLVRLNSLIDNPNYSFSIRSKKGGLNVSFEQNKK